MASLNNFDANTVDPFEGFDPIPANDYVAAIVESEIKDNKDNTGKYLNLCFEILEGEYQGRKVWASLPQTHENKEAVRIGNAKLSAICRAVGRMVITDSSELHNLPHRIKVGIRKRKDNGELVNDIKKFMTKDEVSGQSDQATGGNVPF